MLWVVIVITKKGKDKHSYFVISSVSSPLKVVPYIMLSYSAESWPTDQIKGNSVKFVITFLGQ